MVHYFARNANQRSEQEVYWKDIGLPNVRHQLLREYHLLWKTDPYSLLHKIANSVSDNVYEHIKNVWTMRDAREVLDKILQDLYGDIRGLMETVIQDVKWAKDSLTSKVTQMQAYRTRLHILKSVAGSINMLKKLSRPKLIFRIVDCVNADLYSQFLNENKNFKEWKFDLILRFLDEKLENLKFREQNCFDISIIIGEEKGMCLDIRTARVGVTLM